MKTKTQRDRFIVNSSSKTVVNKYKCMKKFLASKSRIEIMNLFPHTHRLRLSTSDKKIL